MADKNISPEKKLLNIIEGEGKEGEEGKEPKPSNSAKKFFSISALKGRISFLKAKLSKGSGNGPKISFGLGSINVFLQFCSVCIVIYLGMTIKFEFERLNKHDLKSEFENNLTVETEVQAVASLLRSDSYYLNKAKKRNLFGFADDPEEEKKVAFKEEEKEEPTELEVMVKGFKLVGISWSNDPDAIIEDLNSRKTFFVKTGHKINEIAVQAIYRDKVILHYRDQEVELR